MPVPAFLRADSGRLDPDSLWSMISVGLFATLAFCLLILLWAIPILETWIVVFPVLAIGGATVIWTGRSETGILCLIIVAFAAVARYKAGFQVEEILYGALSFGYLGWWFVSRTLVYRDPFIRTRMDWATLLFLIWVTASLAVTILFRGNLSDFVSSWVSVLMFGYYFPVKEAVRRHRKAAPALLGALGLVTVSIALRNMLDYRAEIASSEALWQVATGRVVQNEHVLMMAGLFALVFVLYAKKNSVRIPLLGALFLFTAGVVIGLSRAVWVSYALGGLTVFVLADGRHRVQLLLFGLISLAAILLAGAIAFPGLFQLMFAGVLDRLFSLQTAVTQDISLINRFVESEAVWEKIIRNPVIGYGSGVPYSYYSLVYELTYETTFVHNGYVGVLYRHGLVGFGLLFYVYFSTLWGGFRLRKSRSPMFSGIGIAVVACLMATLLLATAHNPFVTSEKMFFFGILGGLISGGLARGEAGASSVAADGGTSG